jgi:hypothetical protein
MGVGGPWGDIRCARGGGCSPEAISDAQPRIRLRRGLSGAVASDLRGAHSISG